MSWNSNCDEQLLQTANVKKKKKKIILDISQISCSFPHTTDDMIESKYDIHRDTCVSILYFFKFIYLYLHFLCFHVTFKMFIPIVNSDDNNYNNIEDE